MLAEPHDNPITGPPGPAREVVHAAPVVVVLRMVPLEPPAMQVVAERHRTMPRSLSVPEERTVHVPPPFVVVMAVPPCPTATQVEVVATQLMASRLLVTGVIDHDQVFAPSEVTSAPPLLPTATHRVAVTQAIDEGKKVGPTFKVVLDVELAYCVSLASLKNVPTVWVPGREGMTVTVATPEEFVSADVATPSWAKVIDRPGIAVPPAVVSVAENFADEFNGVLAGTENASLVAASPLLTVNLIDPVVDEAKPVVPAKLAETVVEPALGAVAMTWATPV